MTARSDGRDGQILVIFALSMLVIIGIVGLAIDGGATYAQRRDQQTAADLAAMAGANDYLLNNDSAPGDRTGADRRRLEQLHERRRSTSACRIDTSNGVTVVVDIGSAHRNSFLGALGMTTWQVSTRRPRSPASRTPPRAPVRSSSRSRRSTTTARRSTRPRPTSARRTATSRPAKRTSPGRTTGPATSNTNDVDDIITGGLDIDRTLAFGEYIGQDNNGNHTALFPDVNTYLSGLDLPVAIVDTNGNFMGWATFHVNSASGGSNKHINGYFLSSFTSDRLTVSSCSNNACPRYLGSYVLKLTN